MARPNGLCFSPDEFRLYVVDTSGDRPKTTLLPGLADFYAFLAEIRNCPGVMPTIRLK